MVNANFFMPNVKKVHSVPMEKNVGIIIPSEQVFQGHHDNNNKEEKAREI
jgi:hypothetical protein